MINYYVLSTDNLQDTLYSRQLESRLPHRRKEVLQEAIDKHFVNEPGYYVVFSPELGRAYGQVFKVEEVTQPNLRIV